MSRWRRRGAGRRGGCGRAIGAGWTRRLAGWSLPVEAEFSAWTPAEASPEREDVARELFGPFRAPVSATDTAASVFAHE